MYRTTRADRRQNINNYKHWVYGLYLRNNLVYVGVTADPLMRAKNHSEKKEFDEFRLISGFSSRDKANEFERYAIKELRPAYNILIEGTEYVPTAIAEKNFHKLLNSKGKSADFSLLDNAGIQRRIRWQARCV